jgi:hypothetical protein
MIMTLLVDDKPQLTFVPNDLPTMVRVTLAVVALAAAVCHAREPCREITINLDL